MEHMTIGEVSARFQISARMLRYYEKAGLIESTRKEHNQHRHTKKKPAFSWT